MQTVTSISGGKTSAYVAANYPSDRNVFALVRTDSVNCVFSDAKIRQVVSDKLGGIEFVGTLEDDMIIYTILDLEQYLGRKIEWVTGKTFDEIIKRGEKKYLPNVTQRFCTQEMKLRPIFEWWKANFEEPVLMQIGYRANEVNRIANMDLMRDQNGMLSFKDIVGHSKNGRRKWKNMPWQKPVFPLYESRVFKDQIENFWKNKPVRFAYMNNCIGCFHRNEVLLNFMSKLHPDKFEWFADQEKDTGYNVRTFKNGITYDKIKRHKFQMSFDFSDFNDCDSGYCGL